MIRGTPILRGPIQALARTHQSPKIGSWLASSTWWERQTRGYLVAGQGTWLKARPCASLVARMMSANCSPWGKLAPVVARLCRSALTASSDVLVDAAGLTQEQRAAMRCCRQRCAAHGRLHWRNYVVSYCKHLFVGQPNKLQCFMSPAAACFFL